MRCAFAGPMPGSSCSTRNAAMVLRGLSAQRSTASMSLTCAASRNFRPPYFTNGMLAAQQLDLEHVAGAGVAEQHRLLAQQHAGLAALEHLAADEFGLRLQLVGGDVLRPPALAAHRQQVLAVLARRVAHQRIGHVEDRLRGAVVLRQRDDLGARWYVIREAEDVLDRRAAKRIDRLRVVAHHGDAGAVGLQAAQDLALQAVGVLVFIDQHVIEIRAARAAPAWARSSSRASRSAGRRSRAGRSAACARRRRGTAWPGPAPSPGTR